MKVVILCGGMGSRMKEETEFRPKPMVKIGQQPILWHIMKHFAHYGFKDFILALGYRGEMIREYFINFNLMTRDFTVTLGENRTIDVHHNGGPRDDWRVSLVDTGLHTLKGGRLKRVAHLIPDEDELFMMTYGDGVCDLDLRELLAFHKSHGKMATATGVIPSMRFGEITAREDGSVRRFREKNPSSASLVNGGYYVLNRKILGLLTESEHQDFEYGPLEDISDDGELMMNRHEGFWHCMDNVRDMEVLNRMWNEGRAPWKIR